MTFATTRQYVTTPDVALHGGLPIEVFQSASHSMALDCANFLARATYHGAVLNVPMVFRSETMTPMALIIGQNMISHDGGLRALEAIFGTTWELHYPNESDVLEYHRQLEYVGNTDPEYLAVAASLGCTIVTTNVALFEAVQAHGVSIEIILVADHPWAVPGGLEDHPPSE
jgi:predicted nucleic acid-binding protein